MIQLAGASLPGSLLSLLLLSKYVLGYPNASSLATIPTRTRDRTRYESRLDRINIVCVTTHLPRLSEYANQRETISARKMTHDVSITGRSVRPRRRFPAFHRCPRVRFTRTRPERAIVADNRSGRTKHSRRGEKPRVFPGSANFFRTGTVLAGNRMLGSRRLAQDNREKLVTRG